MKVEVKNLNSFRSVERAIDFEVKRQTELLEDGKQVVQETRGWDEVHEKTFSQRSKEDSHDYRYFPDPDLPKLYISEIREFNKGTLAKELPELPWQKRGRYKKDFNLKEEEIEIYVGNPNWGKYFEEVISKLGVNKKLGNLASNYISSDFLGLVKNKINPRTALKNSKGQSLGISEFEPWMRVPSKNFALLIQMIAESKISSRGAKDILKIMYKEGGSPEHIAKTKNLLQKSDETELKKIVEKIIADNQSVVTDYKKGKQVALQFLIGQGMKATKGSANPEILKKIFTNLL